MFVYECIRSEGKHVGVCVDTFMFGSCCSHNLTDNAILPPATSLLPEVNYRPSAVIKTPGERHKPPNKKPQYVHKPLTTVAPAVSIAVPPNQYNVVLDQQAVHSEIEQSWSNNHVHWKLTTEPNFITRPRPSIHKPSVIKVKPTKKSSFGDTRHPSSSTSTRKPHFTSLTSGHSAVYNTTSRPEKLRPPSGDNHLTDRYSTNYSMPNLNHTSTVEPVNTVVTRSSKPTMEPTSSSSSLEDPLLAPHLSTRNVTEIKNDIVTTTASSVSAVTGYNNKECGVPVLFPRPETRIVGGKNAPFGRWPWQVSVRRTSFFGFSSTHRCGGAVLNENWIVTAGHCVDDLLTSQIRIRVGEYDFSSMQEEFPFLERAVSQKLVHPQYNFFTYEYDLALVRLEQPLTFAPHISPICLPGSDDLLIGENATVTGWGRLSEGGTLPSILQEVSVPIVSNDKCKSMFLRAGRHEYIPDIFLCAGHEGGGQDSCQGDSGGPLQVRGKDGHYFLAGIISWGIGCAEANLPGVCTRISKFVSWIVEHVTLPT